MNDFNYLLLEATKEARVPSLPPVYNPKNDKLWSKAIVLVLKNNTQKEYVLAENEIKFKVIDGLLKVYTDIKIVKTFGTPSIIAKVESIHPYTDMLDTYIPEFKKKGECISYIINKLGLNGDKYGIASLDNDSLKLLTYYAANKE